MTEEEFKRRFEEWAKYGSPMDKDIYEEVCRLRSELKTVKTKRLIILAATLFTGIGIGYAFEYNSKLDAVHYERQKCMSTLIQVLDTCKYK